MLQTFRQWSERIVPEDPAMVERDPDIVLKWLAGRIDPEHLPAQQVVLDLNIGGTGRGPLRLRRDRPAGSRSVISWAAQLA
jgi:hypothetical protein